MATRKSPPSPAQANLNTDQIHNGITRLERVIKEIEAFDVTNLTKRWGSEQQALEATIAGALVSVFGHNTVEYQRYSDATLLDKGPRSYADLGQDSCHEARQYVTEGKKKAVQLLKSATKWLADESLFAVASVSTAAMLSSKIFIVHGHDEGARQTVARFIEHIGFEVIILSEQVNQGRTIIEKIEAHDDVGFAVVLLTPDDLGGKTADTLQPRARQNVLLELGYFLGRLGRKRVCTLVKGNLEIPTDFAGVVWERLDDGGAWKPALARELKATGYAIDSNKVMGQ